MADWKQGPKTLDLQGDGFRIAFLTSNEKVYVDSTYTCETTICAGDKHYILNGDWRYEYENTVSQGLPACMEFFNIKKAEYGSSWSD